MLEVIIIIGIISIILSICFVKCGAYEYQTKSFVKQLCSDIRYTRKENILSNPNVYIKFIKENNKWSYVLVKDKRKIKVVYLPQNIELNFPINQNNSLIKFNSNGSYINGGGTITIKDNEKYKYITIVPVSGRVLYKEGIYEK